MPDLEVALLIGAAVVGIVVGLLHLVGYVPPRYRTMLRDVQHETADAIAGALRAEFSTMYAKTGEDGPDPLGDVPRILQELPIKIGEQVKLALTPSPEEQAALVQQFTQGGGIPPQVTGALGGLTKASNAKTADLKNAVGQGLLGPYGALLAQFMPPLYEYLTDNPDMVIQALEMPIVQKLIQKAAATAANVTGHLQSTESGWGT